MPSPGTLVTLTIQLKVTGDGRNDVVTRTPVTSGTFSSFSPPGGLSNNGQFTHERYNLQPGNNTVLQSTTQPQGYPMYYWIMVPPVASTVGKVLKGAVADTGNPLVPNAPLVYALPQQDQQSGWPTLVIQAQAAEAVDVFFV